jgi:two-component system nitrate/nitrite response regulator NarL
MVELECIMLVNQLGLITDCLCSMLSAATELQVIVAADEPGAAMGMAANPMLRMVLVGSNILKISPAGFVRQFKRSHPDIPVLALVDHNYRESSDEVLRAGADGFVDDTASTKEVRAVIRSALAGKVYNSRDHLVSVYSRPAAPAKKEPPAAADPQGLTPRERQVLMLVASANPNKEIGRRLGISVNTVEKHRASVMKKLGAHNAASLTARAIAGGWIAANRPQASQDDLNDAVHSPALRVH